MRSVYSLHILADSLRLAYLNIVLTIYSMAICLTSSNMPFPFYVYIVVPLLYIIVRTLIKSRIHDIFFTMLYISFMLFETDLSNPSFFVLFLLPLFFQIIANYRSLKCLCAVVFCMSVIYIMHLCDFEHPIVSYFSILLLVIIFLICRRKEKEKNLIDGMLDAVDDFFVDSSLKEKKTHEVYNLIIKDFFKYWNVKIEEISCYAYANNAYWLVHTAPNFLWDRKLELSEQQKEKLRESSNWMDYSDDGEWQIMNVIEIKDTKYLYKCRISRETSKNCGALLSYLLPLLFQRISRFTLLDYRLVQYREETYDKYRANRDYVNSALNVVHFIRNCMSPIKNILTYFSIQDGENRPKIKQTVIDEEIKTANKSMQSFLDEADRLLDKQNNPFADTELHVVNVKKLYVLLSESCSLNLHEDVVRTFPTSDTDDVDIELATVGAKILFVDWLSNMKKYGKSYRKVYMSITEKDVAIDFYNDFSSNVEYIKSIVKDINKKDKKAILQRSTHGIYNIITGAEELKVRAKASVDSVNNIPVLHLCLTFPIHKNEHTYN